VALVDEAGTVVERYDYDDFGTPYFYDGQGNPRAGSAYANRVLFTGRTWEAASGLYYYRTRWYDPKAGRFTSRDSIGLWGDEANLGNGYAYVGNNPWTWVDPWGEEPFGYTSVFPWENEPIDWTSVGGALSDPQFLAPGTMPGPIDDYVYYWQLPGPYGDAQYPRCWVWGDPLSKGQHPPGPGTDAGRFIYGIAIDATECACALGGLELITGNAPTQMLGPGPGGRIIGVKNPNWFEGKHIRIDYFPTKHGRPKRWHGHFPPNFGHWPPNPPGY
jgi:RHS repeat-associated protein